MKKPKTKKQVIKLLIEEAENSSWDDLAHSIIVMEHALYQEDDVKVLELLYTKLEIFEEEKFSRVMDSFSMENFMNKEAPHIEDTELYDDDD